MNDQSDQPNGPNVAVHRVTLAEIYRLLIDTNYRVASVDQTVRDVLKPGLEAQQQTVAQLAKEKADAAALVALQRRVEKVELRMYAVVSGIIAAFVGGKGFGIL